jgi:hypothetical protein
MRIGIGLHCIAMAMPERGMTRSVWRYEENSRCQAAPVCGHYVELHSNRPRQEKTRNLAHDFNHSKIWSFMRSMVTSPRPERREVAAMREAGFWQEWLSRHERYGSRSATAYR